MLHSWEKDRHPTAVAPQPGAEESGSPEPVTSDDIPALRAIVEGIAQSTGAEFFQTWSATWLRPSMPTPPALRGTLRLAGDHRPALSASLALRVKML
jgi:hypothetical protein